MNTRLVSDDRANALHDWMRSIRHDLHRHPELGFLEHRTAARVAEVLRGCGLEVCEGVGGTGVVGTLRAGSGSRSIGLRADMDALPMQEAGERPHRSVVDGVFHGCGHDGHVAMLLGAARALAAAPRFDGTVHFVFQPAEEGLGGATAMLEDGLLRRFPCERMYGLHNWPGHALGEFALREGPFFAAFANFDVALRGVGGHAALPHTTRDPVPAAAELVLSLQNIVSRVLDPLEPAVVSVTRIQGGTAYNVIPGQVDIAGCCRYFGDGVGERIESELRRRAAAVADACGAEAEVAFRRIFVELRNDSGEAALCAAVARSLGAIVDTVRAPLMTSDDFAFLAREVPSCYVLMGTGGDGHGCAVHNPDYDFNDAALVPGASYWVRLVERALAP
jgi:hippurate hydrolase